ncbi:MAG: ABC transporter ATP-binding protein [Phycisphaerales bacterium]
MLLACSNVHKSYTLGERSVPALRGVNLVIEKPGFYGIMGSSGSGKSTLLHLLATLDRPDSGTIMLGDRALHSLSEKEATIFRRKQIGVVFQQFNLIPTLTAEENVELPGLLDGDDPQKLRERSKALLNRLGIGERAHHRPDALSGGEQQRVAICRALLYSPPLLLADEPTGNLDSASSAKLWALLAEIAKEQEMLVLMVTHEPAAAAYCSKVFILQDGVVKATMETEGLDAGGVAARYQQLASASR